MVLGGGIFSGLAVLSKLNGSIAGMVLAAWAVLGVVLPRVPILSRFGLAVSTAAAGIVAFATFCALNPFLYARPEGSLSPGPERLAALSFRDRLKVVRDHRVEVSTLAQAKFPHDALPTHPDKLAAVAVQGYGRFSPLGPRHSDSTRRFDPRQDWGVVFWLPLVAAGLVASYRRGREQLSRYVPPSAWAVAVGAIVAMVAVASFIPLAWDRYYLSIQPGAVLLASAALTSPFRRPRRDSEEPA
jgi:hypothetical protein